MKINTKLISNEQLKKTVIYTSLVLNSIIDWNNSYYSLLNYFEFKNVFRDNIVYDNCWWNWNEKYVIL